MLEELQKDFRTDLTKTYLKKAWECFANYQFIGMRYEKIAKEFDRHEAEAKSLEEEIKKIQASPDFHTHDNKEKVKSLRIQIRNSQKQAQEVEPLAKKLYEEMVKWQQDGVRIMEIAEFMKDFKLNTPEETQAAIEKKRQEGEQAAQPEEVKA